MNHIEQKKAAEEFVRFWLYEKGYEKGQTVLFWEELLRDVYGVKKPSKVLVPEDSLKVEESQRFVDLRIPATKVMIEQKGAHIDLTKPERQSGMSEKLTPFQQAHHYILGLGRSEHPKWIVVCNFKEFHIHDMEYPNDAPEILLLENLPNEIHRLLFLVDADSTHVQSEEAVSVKAGNLVGELYDLLLKQYGDRPTEEDLRSLNVLCVRIVFCLYAEDARVFKKKKDMFHDYLSMYQAVDMRDALIRLFRILDTPLDIRSKFERSELLDFPYVNGGLFSEKQYPIEIPMFTDELRALLLDKASYGFDWSEISPTIFGAMFENTLNPKERRKNGMHYTTVENIHKLIGPLFLDGLIEELDSILLQPNSGARTRRLNAFQDKLADICVLDPACGSGNFLTETFLSLRRLENRVIKELHHGQMMIGEYRNPVKVSIEQFYGIEINDFAVNVAKTAMWIAESQMRDETAQMITLEDDFLPLTRQTHIHHGNALRTEWSEIVCPEELNYIVGNPPFVGSNNKKKGDEQKKEVRALYVDENGNEYKNISKLDYVAGWYMKAIQLMKLNPQIHAAFVSTNSIVQGEQVSIMWKPLMEKYGVCIDFAWQSFVWDGEANVHCVIVGFSVDDRKRNPILFKKEGKVEVKYINAYLVDMEDTWISGRKKPLFDVPLFVRGSQATDDSNLLLSEEEKNDLLKMHPEVSCLIRPFFMGKDYIDGILKYCLWLKDEPISLYRKCPPILKRLEKVREYRLKSTKQATQRKAETPHLFDEIKEPKGTYLALPIVSSGNRNYIPMGYLDKYVIPGNKLFFMENASLYHFGIITSSVHMAWMRVIGGRLKSDYSYSNTIVYNNFLWPEATYEQKGMISEMVQAVLDVRKEREKLGDSLADMYDPKFMPSELRKAHKNLDRAVLKLYGLKPDTEEMDIVRHLLGLYKTLIERNEKQQGRSKNM